ncbi:response regulator transcription factor [Pontiellaceae bacterium B12219]|nr:response regulator transcription factor [Pontiellaceae bacterium B12219]
MKRKIKIMLVEDSPAYRKVIESALKGDPDLTLISQFGTAEIALRSLQDRSTRSVPDLILLDLNLPGMSGIEALPYFRKTIPDTKIIVLTQSNREADVLAAITAGTSGYLLKSNTLDQITEAVITVMEGGAMLDDKVAKFILDTLKKTTPKKATPHKALSPRELEILALIGEGLLKKEVAAQLGIGVKTVNTHVGHIFEKLEVNNAASAVNKAYRLGIFSSGA